MDGTPGPFTAAATEWRIGLIGLQGSYLHERIARGAQRRCRSEPRLLLRSFPGTTEGVAAARAWPAHGAVAHIESAALAAALAEWGAPVVNSSLAYADASRRWPSVGPDNVAIGLLAGSHLRELGYRSFAYVAAPGMAYSRERQAAFVAAVDSDQVRIWDELVPEPSGAAAGDGPGEGFAAWLGELAPRTGILVCRDTIASLLCDHARHLGLPIPERLAVVSGLDEEMPCVPALSAVRTGIERWGAAAADAVLTWLASGIRPADRRIPPDEIAVRASSSFQAWDDAHVRSAMAYIGEHCGRDIHVDDVAVAAALSRRALERRFAEQVGRSILQEIHRCRLERARLLLLDTDLPLKAVASRSGFGDAEQLRRAFQRRYGEAPGAFRLRQRAG